MKLFGHLPETLFQPLAGSQEARLPFPISLYRWSLTDFRNNPLGGQTQPVPLCAEKRPGGGPIGSITKSMRR
jgi:hypothetical protein